MVIAIIGSGLSGLVAANRLALAGHEVTIFEKTNFTGGRMASVTPAEGNAPADTGISYFSATTPEFRSFLEDLASKGLVARWTNKFMYRDNDTFTEISASATGDDLYIAPNGMEAITRYLSRPIEVWSNRKVGGITYFGKNRGVKKAWMVNTDSQEVFEADAVIVALPAIQAYGVIQTTQDETSVRRIIREIDEVHYEPCLSFVLGYKGMPPVEWKALQLNHPVLAEVVNESSKRDFGTDQCFVVHTTPEFSGRFFAGYSDAALDEVLQHLVAELGNHAAVPHWSYHKLWKYARPQHVIARDFFENESDDQPLALIGDYFRGTDTESDYISAIKLADHWLQKYPALTLA